MQMLNIGSKFDASSDPWQNGFRSGTIWYESRSVRNYLDSISVWCKFKFVGNDLDPDQFDASLNFKSVANDLDPDRFDAVPIRGKLYGYGSIWCESKSVGNDLDPDQFVASPDP